MSKIITQKLYKYIPFSKSDGFERLKDYFEQKVWMAPISSLNDPFEGKFNIAPSSFENQHSLDLFNMHVDGKYTIDEWKRILNYPKFKKIIPEMLSIAPDFFHSHGLMCLTSKPDNIPMWTYYSDNHRGYCLEFEINYEVIQKLTGIEQSEIYDSVNNGSNIYIELPKNNLHIVFSKVTYCTEKPRIDNNKINKLAKTPSAQTDYLIRNSVGMKYHQWGHEQEFRLIADCNSEIAGLLPLKDNLPFLRVTGVIIGSLMKPGIKGAINKLSKKYHINESRSF